MHATHPVVESLDGLVLPAAPGLQVLCVGLRLRQLGLHLGLLAARELQQLALRLVVLLSCQDMDQRRECE